MKIRSFIAAGVGISVLLLLAGPRGHAQVQQTQPVQQPKLEKHDSNTLHRLGKAIVYPLRKAGENTSKTAHLTAKAVQYPVRKAGENASVTAHTVTGKKSVVHNRQTGQNEVVAPSTTVTPASGASH